MKNKSLIGAAVLAVMLLSLGAYAADAGQFTEVQGKVSLQKANNQTLAVKVGTPVAEGDLVKTDKGSKATVLLKDGSVLRLGPSTNLRINKLQYQEEKGVASSAYDLASGAVMFVVGSVFGKDESNFEVKTPTAVSGVRGTIGIVAIHNDSQTGQPVTTAVSLENTVFMKDNQGNAASVGEGQYVEIGMGGILGTPAPIPQRDLDLLLDLFEPEITSLDDRALGIRSLGGGEAPKGVFGAGAMPELVLPQGGGGTGDFNPDGLGNDNPADLIYQEPPQATELNIIIDVGGGP